MIRLEKINGKNVWEILKLKVRKEQEKFVAPNDLSIIEAYIAISSNGHAYPFGIYEGDTPVGFLMIGYDGVDSFENPPKIAYGNYCIWRLMIDEKYQSKGYGKAALGAITRNLRPERTGCSSRLSGYHNFSGGNTLCLLKPNG